ncbi:MAG: TlyA family RNA methyltransferase [Oscillospiraceae bacterium]|jgi:23S rRNA (cytidine1920-2'-O)/16S rRNA (cytidine1409-2'-O)-methyltransferase|nr:TlyA family RNA methyltransferase [Oscillospiraceae bacterium]
MKKRLDQILVERGLASGRDRAKALIMAGLVMAGGEKALKPGDELDEEAPIEVRGGELKYVSRGGLKLEKALGVFGVDLGGCVCADIGASTGGFTDCMLQNGASRVYAVDVGYGQLDYKLRSDSRVIVLERTNARYLTREHIPEAPDFISADASFISLTLLLPPIKDLLGENGSIICLVKPQFEAGREKVGKKGVVRDRDVHLEVIGRILSFSRGLGLYPAGLDYSPVKGPQGNIEYLLHLKREGEASRLDEGAAARVVAESHERLWGTV